MSNLNCFPLCYICLQISEGSRISRYQLLGHKYERKICLRKACILLSISLLWLPCMLIYFHWNSVHSSVSSWTKRWMLVLEMSTAFWRQRGNGAVEVSFESRTTKMSAFISDVYMLFLSSVIRLIVLPTLPSPYSSLTSIISRIFAHRVNTT